MTDILFWLLIMSNVNNNDDDRQEVTADSSAGVRVQCGTQGDVQTSFRTGQLIQNDQDNENNLNC